MHILVIGLNHKTAPLEVREKVSYSKAELPSALTLLEERAGEGVILSTCNRTEVYSVAENADEAEDALRRFLAESHGLEPESVAAHMYSYRDFDAARHLFTVASGLDSMILGESEILGQVRTALIASSNSRSLGVSLSRLFHGAMRAGRRVREETEVGRNAISISYAGVQLAQRVLGNLGGLRALLVGAGEAGQLVARALRTTGVSDMMVANRTQERAEGLARELAGRAVPFRELQAALERADIAIAATEAPDYVIDRHMVDAAAEGRQEKPLFLFDLSVPRTIDPEVAHIEDVNLFNIDDLSSIAEENLGVRKAAVVDAEQIVEEELGRFMEWWGSQEAAKLIGALRRQAEAIRQRELERALRRLGDLGTDQRDVVEALTRSLVAKLLHDPTVALKQQGNKANLQAARDLFGLTEDKE